MTPQDLLQHGDTGHPWLACASLASSPRRSSASGPHRAPGPAWTICSAYWTGWPPGSRSCSRTFPAGSSLRRRPWPTVVSTRRRPGQPTAGAAALPRRTSLVPRRDRRRGRRHRHHRHMDGRPAGAPRRDVDGLPRFRLAAPWGRPRV